METSLCVAVRNELQKESKLFLEAGTKICHFDSTRCWFVFDCWSSHVPKLPEWVPSCIKHFFTIGFSVNSWDGSYVRLNSVTNKPHFGICLNRFDLLNHNVLNFVKMVSYIVITIKSLWDFLLTFLKTSIKTARTLVAAITSPFYILLNTPLCVYNTSGKPFTHE